MSILAKLIVHLDQSFDSNTQLFQNFSWWITLWITFCYPFKDLLNCPLIYLSILVKINFEFFCFLFEPLKFLAGVIAWFFNLRAIFSGFLVRMGLKFFWKTDLMFLYGSGLGLVAIGDCKTLAWSVIYIVFEPWGHYYNYYNGYI